jgi:soluble lytic murein transglycosylase-like protein
MLRDLSDQFGNVGLAAAAYNAGPRRVIAWLAKRGALPGETRRFVHAITGHSTEAWADAREKADPEVSLMPAKAPCIEVAEAVEEQARVVRVSKLIVELAEATSGSAGETQEARKPAEAETKVAQAEPDREQPAVRAAEPAPKKSARNEPTKTPNKSASETADKPSDHPASNSAPPKVVLTEEPQKPAKRVVRRRPGGVQPTQIAEFDRHRI